MQGNTPSDDLDYPVDEFKYWQLADRYGWTPSQVDNESAYLIDWILAIGSVKIEIEREQSESGSN
jgi:hypothetical protein